MNLLRLSFTAASHKTFRHKALLLSNVNTIIRSFATAAGNSESEERAAEKKMMNPNKGIYMCLIDSLCKHDFIDEAYRVLNKMIVSGFSPSSVTLNDVLRGFIRIGDMRNALDMRNEMNGFSWMDNDTESSLYEGLLDEVTYTSLVNAYLDEGKWDNAINLYYEMDRLHKILYNDEKPHCSHLHSLPYTVLDSVFINGLHKKTRTTLIKKKLLKFNFLWYDRPILEYHRTLAENCSQDEFKRVKKLVEFFCNKGLENVDTLLNSNYKPDGIDDGIVYNLFIIAHCSRDNVDQAYNIYKQMVRSGVACHMITLFALITTLNHARMVNELRWVIQNVLRSCNLNDSEIDKFLIEFDPEVPNSEALFNVLAEKAKDGLFLKCSYAPASS